MHELMTKEELQKVDEFLERVLRALGQMDKNDKNGKWEMPSDVRDALAYEGHWEVQPVLKVAQCLTPQVNPICAKKV